MTQEEKDLLLKDLCARLPYRVKVTWDGKYPLTVTPHIYCAITSEDNIDNIPKLLLRPMSSMNGEEKNEFRRISNCKVYKDDFYNEYDEYSENFTYIDKDTEIDTFEWLNTHHFDYRGLIEKGLAIAVTEENNSYKD